MFFEHFALNVENPAEIADWYVKNCQMKIIKKSDHPHFVRFLSDKTGRVVIEIYNNTTANKIKLLDMHHLEFHFAFLVILRQLIIAQLKIRQHLLFSPF